MAKESVSKGNVEKTAETQKQTSEPTATKQESAYSAKELSESASKLFGTRPECVMAALKDTNKKIFTVAEAKETVEKFLKKEVK